MVLVVEGKPGTKSCRAALGPVSAPKGNSIAANKEKLSQALTQSSGPLSQYQGAATVDILIPYWDPGSFQKIRSPNIHHIAGLKTKGRPQKDPPKTETLIFTAL